MIFDPLYRDLETRITEVAQTTGQRCPPGCGQCCQRPSQEIEASAAEFRPLARNLWERGTAEALWTAAQKAGATGVCVLFEKTPGEGPFVQGRCLAYEYRPLTCRLFGFAAILDKEGKPRPSLSAVMKALDPGLPARVDQALALGMRPPVAAHWRFRMAEIDPNAARELLPLNEALVRAIAAEGLTFRFRPEEPPRQIAPVPTPAIPGHHEPGS